MHARRKLFNLIFNKAGHIAGTLFLFLSFMGVLFHGQFVWTEPNRALLLIEIVLSALWFAGSFIDTVLRITAYLEKRVHPPPIFE